jgi:hypothetical protein
MSAENLIHPVNDKIMTKASSIPRFQPPSEAAHIRQPKPGKDDWRDKSLFPREGNHIQAAPECDLCKKPMALRRWEWICTNPKCQSICGKGQVKEEK